MHKVQSNWAGLSSELWLAIFSCLNMDIRRALSTPCTIDYALRAEAKALHSLPLVCQKFKGVFDQMPSLFCTLWLDSTDDGMHLEAMIKWIHKRSAIQVLVSYTGSPWLEMVLGSLLANNILADVLPVLTVAYLPDVRDATLQVLGHFCKLTTLELSTASTSEQLDLDVLQQLPLLTHLLLFNGSYASLHSLSHLTSLQVIFSDVHCFEDCEFASSLECLLVKRSRLCRFHTDGLSACSSLHSLQLDSATTQAVNAGDTLAISDNGQPIVPYSLSALDALTALSCNIDNGHLPVQLNWLSRITSLQNLHLDVKVQQLEFTEDMSSLKQLTKLDIVADAQIKFDFMWIELVALEQLLICGSFEVPYNLVDVALIKALKRVEISLEGTCQKTIQQIGRLAHALGAKRPDVLFELLW